MSDLQTGDYDLHHCANDSEKCDEFVAEVLENGEEFNDETFDINAAENADGNFAKLTDMDGDGHFINEGLDAGDIAQGGLGDCWFLSALSSLAQPLPEESPLKIKEVAINRVIQTEFNCSDEAKDRGIYRFKFFRLGEFVDVIIDDKLPTRKRASPSESNEWWVPLCEKAYAKFSGSYDKIIGGNTCWALTELTGGITVEMKNLTYENALLADESIGAKGYNLYNLFYRIQNRALICTSNLDDGGNESITNGLVHGHAYSLLRIDEVTMEDGETQKLVKIRNPWAQTEWTGTWCDGSDEWETVSEEEKERIGYEDKDDGGFWMSFKDWIEEFEMFTLCMLPRLDPDDEDVPNEDEAKLRDRRVIGVFEPGISSPMDIAEMQSDFMEPGRHVQVSLTVDPLFNKPTRMVWIQFLLDSPLKEKRFLMFNLYEANEDTPEEGKLTKRDIRKLEKIEPSLPNQKGYVIDYYRHNGYLFNLEAPKRYIICATTATPESSDQPCKFMIRTIGPRLALEHLE